MAWILHDVWLCRLCTVSDDSSGDWPVLQRVACRKRIFGSAGHPATRPGIREKACRRGGVRDANDVINREAAVCWDGEAERYLGRQGRGLEKWRCVRFWP